MKMLLALLLFSATISSNDYLKSVVVQLTKIWPENRMVKIVCHGHGVPAGYAKTPEIRTLDA